ncbi:thiamine phosphate synthase [Profundibacterium mesophilum]|uniref:Thiamine-phosphate synthase n=1 Tax=Profundibacterium mesophilum KAUST100406-0324 TaxID=1037889 RepID=A0A921NP88_9RHOB|nr:thiamine phosphate synthase [Profundibacterium mesophilum]KAF0675187.1 Thiamine-phosphate synthase [Profundibacterium mesophilum KAUST100406-0324]
MAETAQPQLYLITPPTLSLESFPDQLAAILDSVPVACVRLALAGSDEDAMARAGDALREVAHARDVALVMAEHVQLAERLGLDGVHVSGGKHNLRKLREELGADAILGTHCGTSRHDGMNAGEAGADYVCFGPAGTSGLGTGAQAEAELFEWWSEMIEVPVVAEGALDLATIERLAPFTDFFGIGDEIWNRDAPLEALRALCAPIS